MIRNWRIAYCPTLKGKVWNDLTKKCLQNIFTENKNLTEHSLSLHGYWIINWSFVHRWVIQTRVSLLFWSNSPYLFFINGQYLFSINDSIPSGQWFNTCTLSIVPYLLILIVPGLSCQWVHTSSINDSLYVPWIVPYSY